jgi:hypothetical protein
MKQLLLLGISLIAVSACAPQPPPPTAMAPPPSPPPPTAATTVVAAVPPGTAAASPPATTTYWDGVYVGSFTQNQSASGSGCPNFPVAPALTIHNGVAQFAALDVTYQGYVTPEGAVTMQSPSGQTLTGQIDAYGKLVGRTTGRCVYDAVWQRRQGPKPS